jgi:glycosyltransferase involved in cell wall biosynthesis
MASFLFIAPFRIFPATQGDRVAALEYARVLRRLGRVHFLCLSRTPISLAESEPGLFDELMSLVMPWPSAILRAWRVGIRLRPNAFYWYRVEQVAQQIGELARARDVTHLHFEMSVLGAIALRVKARFPELIVTMRLHNIDSRSLARLDTERSFAPKTWLLRRIAPIVERRAFRDEMQMLRDIGRVQTISVGDQHLLEAEGVTSVLIGPPLPALPWKKPRYQAGDTLKLLFAGGIEHGSTGGGLFEALSVLLPSRELGKFDDVWVDVLGAGCDDMLEPWRRHPRVKFHGGGFPSVDHFWDATHVLLAAVRVRRGVRIKVVEALARGIPVIAAEEALYGFEPGIREVVAAYGTTEELHQIMVGLTQNPSELGRLSESGRRYFDEHFSGDACAEDIRYFHEI